MTSRYQGLSQKDPGYDDVEARLIYFQNQICQASATVYKQKQHNILQIYFSNQFQSKALVPPVKIFALYSARYYVCLKYLPENIDI